MNIGGKRLWPVTLIILSLSVFAEDHSTAKKSKKTSFDPNPSIAIGQALEAAWKKEGVTPTKRTSPYQFVRRAYIDIIGRVPTPTEVISFIATPEKDRRPKLCETLVNHEQFPKHWGKTWARWLLRTGNFGTDYAERRKKQAFDSLSKWVEKELKNPNHAHDKMVRKILTATGENTGPLFYLYAHRGEKLAKNAKMGQYDGVPLTASVSQLFLATPIHCAQCHHHKEDDRWLQKDYWQLNGFFRQMDWDGSSGYASITAKLKDNTRLNPLGRIVRRRPNGTEALFPVAYLTGKDRIMRDASTKNRRIELANRITNDKQFAKAYVNRIWAHFFGKGLAEHKSVDDLHPDYVMFPDLLENLADKFRESGHNPRDLVRWICNSKAYNLQSAAYDEGQMKGRLFNRMHLKAMGPTEFAESLITVLHPNATEKEKEKHRETWLSRLRKAGFQAEDGERAKFTGTITQVLELMNGEQINGVIKEVMKGQTRNGSRKQIMQNLVMRVLSRPVHPDEVRAIGTELMRTIRELPPRAEQIRRARALATASGRRPEQMRENELIDLYLHQVETEFWEDFVWAMLNSAEFRMNH